MNNMDLRYASASKNVAQFAKSPCDACVCSMRLINRGPSKSQEIRAWITIRMNPSSHLGGKDEVDEEEGDEDEKAEQGFVRK